MPIFVNDKKRIAVAVLFFLLSTSKARKMEVETQSRSNQKNAKPFPAILRKVRKRIETNFSQLCDQFLFIRNYAKNVDGLFTRIIGKISAFTVLQYINKTNNKPIGHINMHYFNSAKGLRNSILANNNYLFFAP